MKARSDLMRLMFDPEISPLDPIGCPEDHPDFLATFTLAGRVWHAFKAYPGEIVKGWTFTAGRYHHGSSDSLDDFLSDPDMFAENRSGWEDRGRPGWYTRETVQDHPDLTHIVTAKFVSDDQWRESGLDDPL